MRKLNIIAKLLYVQIKAKIDELKIKLVKTEKQKKIYTNY